MVKAYRCVRHYFLYCDEDKWIGLVAFVSTEIIGDKIDSCDYEFVADNIGDMINGVYFTLTGALTKIKGTEGEDDE